MPGNTVVELSQDVEVLPGVFQIVDQIKVRLAGLLVPQECEDFLVGQGRGRPPEPEPIAGRRGGWGWLSGLSGNHSA